MNYYNEIDPGAAAWLRALIKEGLIPDGEVDERSIEDILPAELSGYTQCHFFAGIGGWIYALALAGWPKDRPVWTGSCPCQPFSAAGKGKGASDERHLWPAWFHLIRECRPVTVFGEQVAAAIGHGWLDLVSADLEGEGYTCGPVVLPACGVGAPHIRQRLWWVAESEGEGRCRRGSLQEWRHQESRGSGSACRMADGEQPGLEGLAGHGDARGEPGRLGAKAAGSVAESGAACRMADGDGQRRDGLDALLREEESGRLEADIPEAARCGPTNGFWRDADWLFCRDGKWRPVEPGTFPLVDGTPARVVRLRGYGNSIVPQAAAEVIMAYMGERTTC